MCKYCYEETELEFCDEECEQWYLEEQYLKDEGDDVYNDPYPIRDSEFNIDDDSWR